MTDPAKPAAPRRRTAPAAPKAATPAENTDTSASANAPGVTVRLGWEKATPGTVRFKEIVTRSAEPKLRTVYVTHAGLAEAAKLAGLTLDDVEVLEVTFRVAKG